MNEKHCIHFMTGGTAARTAVGPPNWVELVKGEKLATVEGSAYREDRRAFAGLDASGSEAPWFLPALQIPSSQTEPLIGNNLQAQRSNKRIQQQ